MAMNGHNLFDYDDGLNRTLVLGSATHDELLINSSLYRDLYKSKSETVERLNQSYSDFIALQKKLLEFQNQPVVPVPAHVAPAAAPTPPRRHDQPATRPDHLPASVLWTRADLEGKNKPARSDVAINSDGEKLPANSQFFKQLKTVEDGVKADLRTALSRLGHTTTEQQLPFLGVTELAKSHPELYQNAVSTFESDTILGPVLSLCADHWKSKAIFVWTLENLRKQIKPKAVAKVEKVEPEEDKAEKEELQLSAEKDGEIKKDAAARAQGDQEGRVVDGAAAAVALKPKNPVSSFLSRAL